LAVCFNFIIYLLCQITVIYHRECFDVTALANTVGPEIQIFENVVRVEVVRRGGSTGTYQKAGSLGGHVRKARQPGSEV